MPQYDVANWPAFKERIAGVIVSRTREEWAAILEPAEACSTVVYGIDDAREHPHNVARGTFVEHEGIVQPAPAPRFSRTPSTLRRGPAIFGADTDAALADWGFAEDELGALREAGVFG
jgi:alpha-methylacyl-CoA racemase